MFAPCRRRRIAAGFTLLFTLSLVALPAPAGTAEDLARANEIFERLKTVQASAVNRMERRRRVEFWSRYYQALEQLGRMKVHRQMMTRHRAARDEAFERAQREFFMAVEVLMPMLQDLER